MKKISKRIQLSLILMLTFSVSAFANFGGHICKWWHFWH